MENNCQLRKVWPYFNTLRVCAMRLLLRLHWTCTTDSDLLLMLFLLQIPLKTGSLTGYSVNGLEQHTQIWYMLPPKSREVHQVLVSFFVVGSARKNNLSLTSEEIFWHSPDHWTPRNVIHVAGSWTFTGLISHPLVMRHLVYLILPAPQSCY